MILVQRHAAAHDDRQLSRALAGLVLASLVLFGLVGAVIVLGTAPRVVAPAPAPAARAAHDPRLVETPACRAALARARDSQALSSREAIAASTAMLRACRRP